MSRPDWMQPRLVWDTGDRVRYPLSGATGTVVTVRRGYIIIAWDEASRERVPGLKAREQYPHLNALTLTEKRR